VFNYDMPQDPEDYVHRIGRTARAGAEGDAISLGCEDYVQSLPDIEGYIGRSLPRATLSEDLLAEITVPARERRRYGGPAGGRGRDRDRDGGRSGSRAGPRREDRRTERRNTRDDNHNAPAGGARVAAPQASAEPPRDSTVEPTGTDASAQGKRRRRRRGGSGRRPGSEGSGDAVLPVSGESASASPRED
jgi:ATP-dependent RNA helicase RhlB